MVRWHSENERDGFASTWIDNTPKAGRGACRNDYFGSPAADGGRPARQETAVKEGARAEQGLGRRGLQHREDTAPTPALETEEGDRRAARDRARSRLALQMLLPPTDGTGMWCANRRTPSRKQAEASSEGPAERRRLLLPGLIEPHHDHATKRQCVAWKRLGTQMSPRAAMLTHSPAETTM